MLIRSKMSFGLENPNQTAQNSYVTSLIQNKLKEQNQNQQSLPSPAITQEVKSDNVELSSQKPQNSSPKEEKPQEEEKKKGMSVKKATNILGASLWVGAIGLYFISKAKRPESVKDLDLVSQRLKKIDKHLKKLHPEKPPEGANRFFRGGLKLDDIQTGNKEIFNNAMYGLGTLVIMPLVILFSPLGKKNTSEEDKVFTVLRQPISFATSFSMQLTVDKVLKKLVPNWVKKSKNESFDDSIHKKAIESQMSKMGIDKKDTEGIFKFKKSAFKDPLNELIKGKDQKQIASVTENFNKYYKAKGRTEALTTLIGIATNVVFSAPVGCTMLNVLYGKFMKLCKPPVPEAKPILKQAVGGQK